MPPIPNRKVVPQPESSPSKAATPTPGKRKPDLSKWKEDTITMPVEFMNTKNGFKQKWVKATQVKVKRLGNIAVYPSLIPTKEQPITSEDKWSAGTCTSGQAIIKNAVSEEDAMLIAEVAWSRAKVAFSQPTKELLLKLLPKWVKGWLDKCWETGKFVEPPPESD